MRASLIAIFSSLFFLSHAQKSTEYVMPTIGNQLSEFSLSDVNNYGKKSVSITDFRGKWLILDFWNSGCVACVQSFPKLNQLQKEYQNKVQFLLVGQKDRFVKSIYERFQKKLSLTLVFAFDSILFKKYRINTVPHIIVVDPLGNVKGVLSTIDSTDIESFLRGDIPMTHQKNDLEKVAFEFKKPLGVANNGIADSEFLYRSILTRWNRNSHLFICDFSENYNWSKYNKTGIQEVGITLKQLYFIAYFGKSSIVYSDPLISAYWPDLVLNIKDSSQFKFDPYSGKNVFNYSLFVPKEKATNDFLRSQMQEDLQKFFGFKVKIEHRKMPYLCLMIDSASRENLVTKGGVQKIPFPPGNAAAGFTLSNVPFRIFISFLCMFSTPILPVLDETGIKSNIDIDFKAIMTDWTDIERELKRQGIKLVRKDKLVQVVVISDE